MRGKRGRPSLEDELVETANFYFQTGEELKIIKDEEDKAYRQWNCCRERARNKEAEFAALLKSLLELNDRVNAKRAKEITKLPANVIPMEQRGG